MNFTFRRNRSADESYNTSFQEAMKNSFEAGELGTLNSYEYEEFDKVVKKKGYKIYMDLKYDEQVKFCLLVKKFLILSSGWEIQSVEGGEEQKEFIEENLSLNNLNKSFSTILLDLLSALDYGFVCAEKIWKKENDRIYLKDIKTKFPWNVDFEYDDYGNLTKLLVNYEEMPIHKFIIYSFMEQFGNKKGESDLKASFNACWFKDNVWHFWSRHLERFGSPVVKGHAPQSASPEERSKFFSILNRLTHITGVLLPRSKNTKEEFDFEFVESKREGGDQFVKAMENADTRIARSLMLPQLFGTTGSTFGSYALGSLQFKVVYEFLTFIANNFAEEVVQRQIIKQLIDYNFSDRKYPIFKFKPLSEELVKDAVDKAQNQVYKNRKRSI